ncbi:hypothetical protein N665_0505s0011 [Sinapis alba]|nr:hypothetical protein N665_0505s0011 [Sinapis alba]
MRFNSEKQRWRIDGGLVRASACQKKGKENDDMCMVGENNDGERNVCISMSKKMN